MTALRVLVVEDDPTTAAIHAGHVARVAGFEVAGVARSVREAIRLLDAGPVDLVLLDLNLPDGHGLGIVRSLRSAGHPTDVIAVTAARGRDDVRQAVAHGVLGYLLKPFTFATFRDRLLQYADYRQHLGGTAATVEQADVDRVLGSLRPGRPTLPKGMSAETLERVLAVVRGGDGPLSAAEVAARMGASRITARRYLEHLADAGLARRGLRYGAPGRPELEYGIGRPAENEDG